MFMRSLCAFLLLASSAFAAEIIVDSDRSAELFELQTGDLLRVVDGGSTGSIRLFGDSQLIVDGGNVLGGTEAYDTASIELISGAIYDGRAWYGENSLTQRGGSLGIDQTGGHNELALQSTMYGSAVLTARIYGGSPGHFLGWHGGGFLDLEVYDSDAFYIQIQTGQDRFAGSLFGEDASLYFTYQAGTTAEAWNDGRRSRIFWAAPSNANRRGYLLAVDLDSLSGDTNADGVVDLEDLNAVRNNFGNLLSPTTLAIVGDTSPYDGKVDLEDLNRVRNNFGASSNPVPEPSTLALAVAALVGVNVWHFSPGRSGRV